LGGGSSSGVGAREGLVGRSWVGLFGLYARGLAAGGWSAAGTASIRAFRRSEGSGAGWLERVGLGAVGVDGSAAGVLGPMVLQGAGGWREGCAWEGRVGCWGGGLLSAQGVRAGGWLGLGGRCRCVGGGCGAVGVWGGVSLCLVAAWGTGGVCDGC